MTWARRDLIHGRIDGVTDLDRTGLHEAEVNIRLALLFGVFDFKQGRADLQFALVPDLAAPLRIKGRLCQDNAAALALLQRLHGAPVPVYGGHAGCLPHVLINR